jgi:hypothetical protein
MTATADTSRCLLTRPALAELLRVAGSEHELELVRTRTVRAVVAELVRLAEVGHAVAERGA